MKRFLILLLALALLPVSALAADVEIPQIDPAAAGIAARPIASQDDAIAYAKALWASDYLYENTEGMLWLADLNDGVYEVTARTDANGIADLVAEFGADGSVTHLFNGISRSDPSRSGTYDEIDEAALIAYLFAFKDALNPGAAAALERPKRSPKAIVFSDRILLHFEAPIADGNGTVAFFAVEVLPQVRILDYRVFIPLAPSENSRG